MINISIEELNRIYKERKQAIKKTKIKGKEHIVFYNDRPSQTKAEGLI